MDSYDEKTPLLVKLDKNELSGDSEVKIVVPEKKKDAPKPVPFFALFTFAKPLDIILVILGTIFAGAAGCAMPVLNIVLGDMTDDFIAVGAEGNYTNSTNATPPIDLDDFEDNQTDNTLKLVYIGIGSFTTTYLYVMLWNTACQRQTHAMRKQFFRALLRQNIGWYDQQQSGELTTRLSEDLEKFHQGLGDKFGQGISFMAQFLAGFAVGFEKSWEMTLVLSGITPLLAISGAALARIITKFTEREQESYARAGAVAEEVLSCIRTVISFNGQQREITRYTNALEQSKNIGIKKAIAQGMGIGCILLFMFSDYAIAFWYGSHQVDDYNTSGGDDGIDAGTVFTVFSCIMVGSLALGMAAPNITAVFEARGAAGTILDIIKKKPVIDCSDIGGKRPQEIAGHIQLKNIDFRYPTRPDILILSNFSLDIAPGSTVALVGSSGCGKSTIINLVQRFYDPARGRVILDGEDLRDLNIRWLRTNIGIVSQEPNLFAMTIAENIALGRPGITMDDIRAAAKMANAHDFISALPSGYHTMVGERGAQLSGGQKQRIAIARALVRDPSILLLDEATSALDSESEYIVQNALDKASEGRTTIVIAHRLSTVQNADVIYVLDKGVVVEQGKHLDLMARKGFYYNLVMLQTLAAQKEQEASEIDTHLHEQIGDMAAVLSEASQESDIYSSDSSRRGFTRNMSRQSSRRSSAGRRRTAYSDMGSTKRLSLFTAHADLEDDQAVPRPGFFRIFQTNLPELKWIIIGCTAAIVNGAIMPVFAVFFSEIIKTFGKTGDDLLDEARNWSLVFLGLGVLNLIVNFWQQFAFGVSGENLTQRLRGRAFQAILRQDVGYFDDDKNSTGALTTRLANEASMVKNATGLRLATIIQSGTSMVAGVVIAFIFGWKLAMLVLGGVPLVMLQGFLQLKVMTGNIKRDAELLEESGKTASECIENIRTVQSLTREPFFYDKYADNLVKPHKEALKQAHVSGVANAFSQSIVIFLFAGSFRFGAYLVVHDGMAPDKVFRVLFAIMFSGMAVGQAMSFLPDYSKAQIAAAHLFELFDRIPTIDIYSKKGVAKSDIHGEVALKNVVFSYPTRSSVNILKGMSVRIHNGQTVALVGMSGCGKSTVISLVQRFYDPVAGKVLVDGKDIRDYNLKNLRSFITVVSQEPILFDTSIRQNIVYGMEDQVPKERVINACKTANIHDFISHLPQGYETEVGEKGTQLSGGQKQRIAIARALIRNPRILLLDEATSALDTESEKIVQTALDNAREGRSCIVIAHRLSTIQNADVIYVLEKGKVVEHGTHQDLLAKQGAYAALVRGQKFKTDED